jgi:hypothetical protein
LSNQHEECQSRVKADAIAVNEVAEDHTSEQTYEVTQTPDMLGAKMNVAGAVDDRVAVSSQDFTSVDQKSAEAEQTEAKKKAEECPTIMSGAEKTKRVYNKQRHASSTKISKAEV